MRDRSEWLVGGLLVAAVVGFVAFGVVFLTGANTQLLGLSLAIALAAVGVALSLWSHRLAPSEDVSEPRPELSSGRTAEAEQAVEDGAEQVLGRRTLAALLAAAAGGFTAAVALPLSQLGPEPPAERGTAWRSGRYLVDRDGQRVHLSAMDGGTVVTAFPEGEEQRADDEVLLLALPAQDLQPSPGREDWSPDGVTAYSKVCTHAGCPVGLYEQEHQQLVCPCHQATFDVLRGARPVFGPAPVALPQLPLRLDDDGFLLAAGPLSGEVGPRGWWSGGDEA